MSTVTLNLQGGQIQAEMQQPSGNGIRWDGLVMADFTGRDGSEIPFSPDIQSAMGEALGNTLGQTTVVTSLAMQVVQAFNTGATLNLGTAANHSIILADANFKKVVGKKNIAPSGLPFLIDAGAVYLYGAATAGKIAVWFSGITYRGSDLLGAIKV